jgi:hypothetical protein
MIGDVTKRLSVAVRFDKSVFIGQSSLDWKAQMTEFITKFPSEVLEEVLEFI